MQLSTHIFKSVQTAPKSTSMNMIREFAELNLILTSQKLGPNEFNSFHSWSTRTAPRANFQCNKFLASV